ncbi:hypothetical protein GGR56DRAFT_638726 [Xylariaceae sp. FL0804]|nr:hypothetical protein GGR56DRAFT_638726 [Xylariaceae sp. FL0804]
MIKRRSLEARWCWMMGFAAKIFLRICIILLSDYPTESLGGNRYVMSQSSEAVTNRFVRLYPSKPLSTTVDKGSTTNGGTLTTGGRSSVTFHPQ